MMRNTDLTAAHIANRRIDAARHRVIDECVLRAIPCPRTFHALAAAVRDDYGAIPERGIYRSLRRLIARRAVVRVGRGFSGGSGECVYVRGASIFARNGFEVGPVPGVRDHARMVKLLRRYAVDLRAREEARAIERWVTA